MMPDKQLSEVLKSAVISASATAAAHNMHAEIWIGRAGLNIVVTAGRTSKADATTHQSVLPWAEIDRTDALDVLVSAETLTLVEALVGKPKP
jgi:hypothetical protein